MEPRLVTIKGEECYFYDLPEGKTYYIQKCECDLVANIVTQWSSILENHESPDEIKERLKEHSSFINSVLGPPIGTKISSFTKEKKHYAKLIIDLPEFKCLQEIILGEDIPFSLRHVFLVEKHPKGKGKEAIYGALEKHRTNKNKYMMHRPAQIHYKEGLVHFSFLLKRNEVYRHITPWGWHIVAKNKDGKIIRKYVDTYSLRSKKALEEKEDALTAQLLLENVLPHKISKRVKRYFPAPCFDIESLLIKTEHSVRKIPHVPHLILNERNSSHYRYLKNPKHTKRKTPMPYLGNDLLDYFSECIISKKPLPNEIQQNPLAVYVYKNKGTNVYQPLKTQGKEICLDSSFSLKEMSKERIEQIFKKVFNDGNNVKISLKERVKIAKNCCDIVLEYHKKNLLVVDIKRENFTHNHETQQTSLIDDGGIINSGERAQVWTPKNAAPELANYHCIPTVETDTFAMGVTIKEIIGEKYPLITQITNDMRWYKPKDRLPLSTASALLNVYSYDETYRLVDFTYDSIKLFESEVIKKLKSQFFWKKTGKISAEYHAKQKCLADLLKNLMDLPLERPLSYLEQKAFMRLINQMPNYTEWNTVDNIIKILDPQTGPVLTCTLLGSLEYLEKNKHYSNVGRTEVQKFIKETLFTQDNTAITKAIGAIKENSQSNKLHSRAETLDRFNQIQEALNKITHEKELTDKDQIFIYKMNQFFPEYWKEADVIHNICNSHFTLTRDILINAISYMEETKQGGHSKGRQAVKNFVKNLIILNKDIKDSNLLEDKIQQEKNDFLFETKSHYRCSMLWGPSGASRDPDNQSTTRKKIFNSSPPRTS